MIKKRYWGVPLWLWILTALTICFIWGNSALPSAGSRAVVAQFKQLLKVVAPWLFDSGGGGGGTGGGGGGSTGGMKVGTVLLRKSAHIVEFSVLGVELSLLLRGYASRPLSLLALCGVAIALVDETIQLFLPGRSGEVKDIWIDLGGFLIGCVLCLLVLWLRRRKKRT